MRRRQGEGGSARDNPVDRSSGNGVLANALQLEEEGMFRTIVAYLGSL